MNTDNETLLWKTGFAIVVILWLAPLLTQYAPALRGAAGPNVKPSWNSSRVLTLVMVRNEERIIGRLLQSVQLVGASELLFVCDTGSTDRTADMAKANWPADGGMGWHYAGEFHDFETSRNLCMDAAKQWVGVRMHNLDWVLLPDADFTLHAQAGVEVAVPEYDLNVVQIKSTVPGAPQNALPLLVRASTFFHSCRYRMWTHEVLDCCNSTTGYYNALYWMDHSDGVSRPAKLKRDINLLEQWLYEYNRTRREAGWRVDWYARGLYYLARAHEDSNHTHEAYLLYQQHNAVQPWTSYQFYARYRMALITLNEQRHAGKHANWTRVEQAFLEAYSGPDGYFRREPLYYLAYMFHELHQWNRCVLYASAGLAAPPVDHSRVPLFLEADKYEPSPFQRLQEQCVWSSKTLPIGV